MNGSANYTYSNTGSLTGTGVATFSYDAWDRLVGITTTTGSDAYEYDALGRRVSRYITGKSYRLRNRGKESEGRRSTADGENGSPPARDELGRVEDTEPNAAVSSGEEKRSKVATAT